MDYRPILRDDLQACLEVFYAADDELQRRNGLPLNPRNEARLLALFEHIVTNDPGRVWLAEEGARVIGFGMSAQRGDLTFLAFLFVLPDVQGQGIGRKLLEHSMAASTRRAVCIFSVQPVSAGLYAQYGMVPLVPIYTMTGRPRTDLPALPMGMRVERIDARGVDALDADVTGFTRQVDHAAWATWDRTRFGLFDGDQLVGYAYAQPAGRLGPVVCHSPELVLPFVGQLMQEIEPVEDWMLNVPGPATEPFEALLRAGFRFDGPPVIFCASENRIDHRRYLPTTFALP